MSILRCFLPVMLTAAIGCGGDKVVLPTAPVAGTATYRGKPLGMGRVIFLHESGQAAAGVLHADGSFKLVAFQGENQVAFECRVARQPHSDGSPRMSRLDRLESFIPARYAEFGTSGFRFEVKPGENKVAFALKD